MAVLAQHAGRPVRRGTATERPDPRQPKAQPSKADSGQNTGRKPAARSRRQKAMKPLPWPARAWRVTAIVAMMALAGLAVVMHRLPDTLALAYPVMGAISFVFYGIDKRRAVAGAWRVPESTLHFVDFFGGIAGGLLAQLTFRHKTSKFDFLVVSASFAALHIAALLLVLSPVGAAVLHFS